MTRGAYWAGKPLQSDAEDGTAPSESTSPADHAVSDFSPTDYEEAPARSSGIGEKLVLALFALVAFGWVAAMAGLALSEFTVRPLGLADTLRGISIASGPLALIAALVILLQRNSRREANHYADVARSVRMETLALDAVLNLTSRRLAEDRAAVAEQADMLLSLAEITSTKMRGVTEVLSREIGELGRQSRDLDAAAGTARVDMGVLLADLPIAERQVGLLTETIRATGLGAHEQAAALEAVLAAVAARARDADENTAGAANRLSAQVSRIAGASEIATRDIDEAGQRMTVSIDGVLQRAADAVERTHQGITAQGDAIDAMIERGHAAAESMSAQATAALESRVNAIGEAVHAIATYLARQDGVGAGLVERLEQGLGGVEARFAELDETGRARTERLGEALGALGTHAERTMVALNEGGTAATTLINRAETLRAAIRACLEEMGEGLPAALARLEAEAAKSRATIDATNPEVERLNVAAAQAAGALEGARVALDERRAAIDTLAETITAHLLSAQVDAMKLREAVQDADIKATRLADSTSPKLVDALIRVRETAGQAAERASEALASIIPGSAAALGEAGRQALEAAIGEQVYQHVERVTTASRDAVDSARAAAVRLEEQLARVADTSASVETRIAEGKAIVENSDRDNFSRRVALLIDSLNSTSIDVTKLLSNEASDSAWTAYLRGDRGVFTRRAVRLLEGGEAREITRHYEEEPDFRDQVNRYIHDFEALLRPILATRDGSALAVVMLSSEMGKLYVALAQAIERLRT